MKEKSKEKSIEGLEAKSLNGFTKAFGSKIYGGCTTWTIEPVVINPKPKPDEIETNGGVTNDGSDGNGPC